MKHLFTTAAMLFSMTVFAQVGINNTSPKATLDITAKTSGTKPEGLIIPQLSGDQIRTATAGAVYGAAQKGLIVYASSADTAPTGATANITAEGYYYFDGSAWQKISTTGNISNIYNSDGTLTGTRTVNTSGNALKISGGGTLTVQTDDNSGKISLNPSDNSHSGYLSIFKGNNTRLGYIGFNNTNINYVSENGANHVFSGYVGIGESAPKSFLHINTSTPGGAIDAATFSINNCGAPCGNPTARNIVLHNYSSYINPYFASIDFVAGTDPLGLSGAAIRGIDRDITNNYAGLSFFTRNATDYDSRMVIKSSGRVGIGASAESPNATLDVKAITTGSGPEGIIAPRLSLAALQLYTYNSAQTGAIVYVNSASGTPTGQTANVTAVGYYYFDGSAWQKILNTSLASGNIYLGNASGIATAVAPTGDVTISNTGVTSIGAGKVTNSQMANSAALTVKGNATNASAAPTDIAAGTDGYVLRRSGTTLGFGTVATAGIADGAVTAAKLNQMSASTGQVLSWNGTSWAPAPDATGLSTILGSGKIYVGNASSVATAVTPTGDVTIDNAGITSIGAGKVTNSQMANSAALTVKGNATNASAAPTDIAAGTDGYVLRRSGTALGFGTVASAGIADGAVTAAKLNQMSATSGQVLGWNGTAWTPTASDATNDAWINDTTNGMVKLGTKADGTARSAGTDFVAKDNGQIGIGTSSPNASAALDITASNKGLLIPRVALTSTIDQTTVATPANGLIVYNTAATTGAKAVDANYMYVWNGSLWAKLATSSDAAFIPSTSLVRRSNTNQVTYENSGVANLNTQISQITDGNWNSTTNTYTIPSDGTYQFSLSESVIYSSVTTLSHAAGVLVAGNFYQLIARTGQWQGLPNTGDSYSGTLVLYLTAGTTVIPSYQNCACNYGMTYTLKNVVFSAIKLSN